MKKFIYLVLILLFTSACEFKDVDFVGTEGLRVEKFEGRQLLLDLGLKIKNDNGFKIKIKPSTINVFVEGQDIGLVHLDEKVVIKKKTESSYPTKFRIELSDGFMLKLMRLATRKEVAIRFQGKVKASVFGICKKFPVDETRMISRDQLMKLRP